MNHLPAEDPPPEQWRRFGTEEKAHEALPSPGLTTPGNVGAMFCEALRNPRHYLNALRHFTTPESWDDWGDFRAASEALTSIQNYGFSNRANRAHDAETVAYFKILKDVPESFRVIDRQIMAYDLILSMVWRPELESWRSRAMGSEYFRPEELPRTAA